MSWKIEEGVPPPPKSKYPFIQLEKGQSAFWECSEPERRVNACYLAAWRARQATGGVYRVRIVDGGIRVFRVA